MKKSAWFKLTLIIVSIAMVLSLVACGDLVEDDTTATTEAPVEQTTEAPTTAPTEKATEEPTEEPTTEAPTAAPTEAPTTEAPTEEPTEEPTETETETDPYEDFAMVVLPEQLTGPASTGTGLGSAKVADDGSYINIPGADAGDGWLLAISGNTAPGKYVVLKYRYNNTNLTTRYGYSGNVNGGPTGNGDMTKAMPVVSDGQWHIAVYNMTALIGADHFVASEDGSYVLKYWRMDIADNLPADASIDIAYVGIVTDVAVVVELAKAQGDKTVDVSETADAVATYYTSTGTTNPAPEDVVDVFVGPAALEYASVNTKKVNVGKVSEDGDYISWTSMGAGGDGYVLAYSNGSVVSGQYLVLKYRYAATNMVEASYIEVFTSCTNANPAAGDNFRFNVKADGEWHVQVVDLSKMTMSNGFVGDTNGTYSVRYIRLDVLDAEHASGDCIDVAYLALTDNIDGIIAANMDVEAVDYKLGSTKSDTYTLYTATGTTIPAPEFFFGPEQLAAGQNNFNGKADIKIAEDGSYVSFVRNQQMADGYVMLLNGNTEVTGQYVVIKYRTDHMPKGEFWANTTENGHAYQGAAGKTNHQMEFITDGEWHILVVDLATKTPNYVVANEDGTYVIQWSRLDALNNAAAEGYFDIAFIIFTDDVLEASTYITEEDAAKCAHEYFVTESNGDQVCKICGNVTPAEVETDVEGSDSVESDVEEGIALEEILNVYATAEDVSVCKAGTRVGERVLADDESYVSIYGSGAADGVLTIFPSMSGVSGQYIVIKYRYPDTNKKTYSVIELWSCTTHGSATSGDNTKIDVTSDGNWHVAVINFAERKSDFVAAEDGTYSARYLRADLLDEATPSTDCIQIALIGFTDSVEDILEACSDCETVQFFGEEDSVIYVATGTTEAPEATEAPETAE